MFASITLKKHLTVPAYWNGSVSNKSTCNAGDPGLNRASKNPLEKEMPTHCGILAWEIPWTVEPGGLESMG